MTHPELPFTPYTGTGGHAGSEASRERAEREAVDGTLADRQQDILDYLAGVGVGGATWVTVGQALSLHHGQVSGALSNLHTGGAVFMLRKRHNRSHPYVHVRFRAFYNDNEVHDEPKTTKAGQRRARLEELATACRNGLASEFDRDHIASIVKALDELA
jgi:hypothetical protein